MSDEKPQWPPYPHVVSGAKTWEHVLKVLRRDGTKRAAHIADQFETQIDQAARRSADYWAARGGKP